MLSKLKKALRHLMPKSEQERMMAFLSQAQSHEHLEHLERQWFSSNGERKW
jgi:hypothetical protein